LGWAALRRERLKSSHHRKNRATRIWNQAQPLERKERWHTDRLLGTSSLKEEARWWFARQQLGKHACNKHEANNAGEEVFSMWSTPRLFAREQLSVHGSSEHATMGALLSMKPCYSSLLGSTTIWAKKEVFSMWSVPHLYNRSL
jgi:hypothetical protein